MFLSAPTSMRLLSSIAGQSSPTQTIDSRSSSSKPLPDPLDGSLGVYAIMCCLVLVIVLGTATILSRIRVHRQPRIDRALNDHAVSDDSSLYLPSFPPSAVSVNTLNLKFKLTQNPLRVRAPLQRLNLFRSDKASAGSTAIPLWTSPDMNNAAVVPAIVISRCSPMLPFEPTFPSVSSVSMGSLRIPDPSALVCLRTVTPSTISQIKNMPASESEAENIPLELTPMNQPRDVCTSLPEKAAPKRLAKKTHRRGRPIGKENTAPALYLKMPSSGVSSPQRVLGLFR